MIERLKNIFCIPDLRNRVLFTLGMLAIYRLGNHVPIPGVDVDALALTALYMSPPSRVTVFALGIMPYIIAWIILQLLTMVWPYLERLSKEGELGRRKITQYTRYGTVLLSVIQSARIAAFLQKTTLTGGITLVANPGFGFTSTTVITLTAGAVFIMWLGEQITERGVGNGMSLLIIANIVVGFPYRIIQTLRNIQTGQSSPLVVFLLSVFMVVVVAAFVFVERGQRRIPVQYDKGAAGRRIYQGQSTHLPLSVNTGGVVPVIFAGFLIQ